MPIKPDTFDTNDTHVGDGEDTMTAVGLHMHKLE